MRESLRWLLLLFPVYLEWTKASLRTTLLQSTRGQLLQEVAAVQKIKTIARVKFNILIFIFSCKGTMKQAVKHSEWIEKEKPWKHLFHLLQVLKDIILEICEILPKINRIV